MARWTAESRHAYKQSHPENFAGHDESFPIKDQEDVQNAWDLAGHAPNPDQVRAHIKEIAQRLHLKPPREGANETDKQKGRVKRAL